MGGQFAAGCVACNDPKRERPEAKEERHTGKRHTGRGASFIRSMLKRLLTFR
ncbi:MAG: hypothetical protein QOG25_3188, partial [Acetobacteraceae bacterium]|nr:hypothetical protein [Acetobacteraceae bacterium]